ncbi:hypothetical protein LLS1_14760 [Leifsonia sp. LS1]|uniref:hypothetical protein n=1 Tax=Leifsonia sp. LS1 TaxID=2828483 RepID=UPI001CFE609A|nr:hypothetical protein [Leifsonia sp. LS1]GIT79807.1 hypothetical protein LLS1_14760 [Leifsonia sp. LS1]
MSVRQHTDAVPHAPAARHAAGRPVTHAAHAGPEPTAARPATRAASRAGDALLTLASVAGALCILGAIAATVFHLTLILFSTGSMSPTIPAGAVALVREIPAAEARVGDIVTVDRPRALPITHRVVSARPVGEGRVEFVLRGDANAENDPAPYDVSHVRLVIASVPGGAPVIAFFSNPLFLGGATLAATALVAWAFWPRGAEPMSRRRRRGRRDADDDAGPGIGAGPGSRAMGSALVLLLTVGAGAALALAAPSPARADESVSSGRYLTLTSVADPTAFAQLRPGVPVRWEVGVAAATPSAATVGLGLSSTGPLTGVLDIGITACAVRWSGTSCPGAARTLLVTTPLSAVLSGPGAAAGEPPAPAGVVAVGAMPSSERRWLAIDVTLQPGAADGSADLDVWAWTSADDVQAAAPPVALAATGAAPTLLTPLLAGGAVVAGAGIAAVAGARRHRHPGDEAGAR